MNRNWNTTNQKLQPPSEKYRDTKLRLIRFILLQTLPTVRFPKDFQQTKVLRKMSPYFPHIFRFVSTTIGRIIIQKLPFLGDPSFTLSQRKKKYRI